MNQEQWLQQRSQSKGRVPFKVLGTTLFDAFGVTCCTMDADF